jgi:nucleoside-diphosphate-sugar epimerase
VRVLLTGGFGCIGSWVAKKLAESGEEVWIFDLREDTHRLDLIVQPALRRAGLTRSWARE